MALAVGTKLGPYQIESAVGAGGMGEVYRARDTRLDRSVAVKILPAHLSCSTELRHRFEREARTISSLNDSHICTLYDVGHQDGIDFLVMEYLEGETLGQRLNKGPLPIEQALKIAVEIGGALAKAHQHGILHRDLKPSNIMLTKAGAKLMDFGLAKSLSVAVAAEVGTSGASLTPSPPTVTLDALSAPATPLTQHCTVVGTFQYMAPEVLRGSEADVRSDIFSFGAVLYEMLTGKAAFQGKSHLSVLAAILEKDPEPISQIQPLTPPALEHVVRTCLAKEPEERWQSAQDLVRELQWLRTSGTAAVQPASVASPLRHGTLGWIAAGILLLASIGSAVVILRLRQNPEHFPAGQFLILLPQKVTLEWYDFPAVSPNGEYVAFAASWPDGKRQLWVRKLDSLAAEALPGTEGAYAPFWSPDSKSIGFAANAMLEKVDLLGGSPQTLCDAPCGASLLGSDWSADGVIVSSAGGQIYRLPASGGQTVSIAEADRSRQETGLSAPRFLPDGRHFLYAANSPTPAHQAIYLGSLDSKERKVLANTNSVATYVAPGYLVYVRGGTLLAQPFDLGRLQLTGEAFPVPHVGPIGTLSLNNMGALSVSRNGVLAYLPTGGFNAELAWYDRRGARLRTVGAPAAYTNPALSPDNKRLAVSMGEPNRNREIWIFDLVRGNSSRLTFDRSDNLNPTWSRDGSQILFTSDRKGHRDIYEQAASGLGGTQLVFESTQFKAVNDWSDDGRYIVYDLGTGGALWVLPMFGERRPFPFVEGGYSLRQAQLSSNGHYIAYSSAESGTNQIYVQTFPEHHGKWQISTNGGVQPRWRGDGKELFYLAGTKVMAVDVNSASLGFQAGIPRLLFDAPPLTAAATVRNSYVATPDGQQFLFVASLQQTASGFNVVVNLPALLKR